MNKNQYGVVGQQRPSHSILTGRKLPASGTVTEHISGAPYYYCYEAGKSHQVDEVLRAGWQAAIRETEAPAPKSTHSSRRRSSSKRPVSATVSESSESQENE